MGGVRPPFVEAPVVFGRDRSLVGATCVPREPEGPPTAPAILFISSGIIHRTGPNRIYVSIGRALASEGFSSLRFDLSGIGDSVLPPSAEGRSIQERVEADIDDAIDFMAAHFGAHQFVLIGLCSGADNALRTMGRRDDVVGAVLLDLNTHLTPGFWVRHYGRRLLRANWWMKALTGRHRYVRRIFGTMKRALGRRGAQSVPEPEAPSLNLDAWVPKPLMREYFERIVTRGGRLLCIFTAGLPRQYNYREQLLEVVPGIDFRDRLTLEYYEDSDHTFSREELRDRLTTAVVDWVRQESHEPRRSAV